MPRRRRVPSSTALSLPLEVPDFAPPPPTSGKKSKRRTPSLTQDSLLSANAMVLGKFQDLDEWSTSPYAWVRSLPTATRSKAAEAIVETLLSSAGFLVQPRSAPGHDRLIAGRTVKIRFSTRWSSGLYTFQQVLSGKYEYLVLFGLSPSCGHVWILDRPSAEALTDPRSGWISFNPDAPPAGLAGHGGDLGEVMDAVSAVLGPPNLPPIPMP